MPSEFYIKNWEKCNKWLNENAPKYVLDCIQELADTIKVVKEQEAMKKLKDLIKEYQKFEE